MINVVTILFESITTWLCLHIVFGKKIEKRWLEVGFSGVYVLLSILCSYKVLSKFFLIFIVVWAVIWAKKMFDEKISSTIIKSIIAVVALGVIEMLVMFVSYSALKAITSIKVKCLFGSILCALMLLIMYAIFSIKGRIRIHINKYIVLFTFTICGFLLYIKVQFEEHKQINYMYVFFFCFLGITFICMLREQKKIYELEKNNQKLQLQNMYGKAYEELLYAVRTRQHDYRNQIIAIESMYLSAKSIEELVNIQKEYISILGDENRYDGILLKCNNPIISGYLYNTCMKYSKENIIIEYDINVVSNDIDVKTKEVIEILGVLISNAAECYNNTFGTIKLIIKEINKIFRIEVRNKAEYISYGQLENIFKRGYSTKGEDRGIGLYSVKNIVDKFEGTISVNNVEVNEENWVNFCVVI